MITRVTEADLDDVLALMRSYCDFYDASPSDAGLCELSRTLIAHPDSAGLQLLDRGSDDGLATGFATVYWTFSTLSAGPIAVMNDIYVLPAFRGRGIATALIAACADEAARRGAVTLDWFTSPTNVRAQRVYDRVGAERNTWLEYSLSLSGREARAAASSPAED